MTGKWTAIVVPHYPYGEEKTTDSIPYNIKAEVRHHNAKRVDAGLSAANAAVIASYEHAPLLYVTEDAVPTATANAISQLGATNIIFVNLNKVSSASPPGSVNELTDLTDVVTMIFLEFPAQVPSCKNLPRLLN